MITHSLIRKLHNQMIVMITTMNIPITLQWKRVFMMTHTFKDWNSKSISWERNWIQRNLKQRHWKKHLKILLTKGNRIWYWLIKSMKTRVLFVKEMILRKRLISRTIRLLKCWNRSKMIRRRFKSWNSDWIENRI